MKFLRPGKNCWCSEKAERIAFLVDGEAIFNAFESVAEQAEKSLLIVGWDIDSRVRMRRSTENIRDDDSNKLGPFLNNLAKKKENLEIHILIWDFSVIYASERELLPIFNLDWKTHRRIHFALDSEHPLGASHHQKIVVVDDEIAMVGGLDLTNRRWDSPQHLPDDPRRIDPLGTSYLPFHDVQMLVQGPVACKLGDLSRERWHRATGENLSAPSLLKKPGWPASIAADLYHQPVAVVRTEPAFKNRPEVREIQTLYTDAIATAAEYIYIENQYLTSTEIVGALSSSLEKEKGPEIVILLPKSNCGWLEENTMGRLRSIALMSLFKADCHKRLAIYGPVIKGEKPGQQTELNLHSKVMIIDDRFALIGSANLNNRSMGLDTECALAVETSPEESMNNGIAQLLDRLLAEHLGATPQLVRARINAENSLLKAIGSLTGNVHSLEALRTEPESDNNVALQEIGLLDPERPIGLDLMMDKMLIQGEERPADSKSGKLKLFIAVLVILAMIGVWQFTPLQNYLEAEKLIAWAESFRNSPLSWFYILLLYVIGGLIFFPVTVQIIAVSALFSPLTALFLSVGGCTASAAVAYGVGFWLGRDMVRSVAGGRLNKISKQIARKGLIAIGVLRIVPVAPFTLVNLVAGASHIRFRDYLLGTFFGMLPGIVALTLLTNRLKAALTEPGLGNVLILVGFLLLVGVGALFIKKRLSGRE